MENKGPEKENIKAIIEDSLIQEKNYKNIPRNFHPVFGKPYYDMPAEPGVPLKKNNNQHNE
jgi:hypothetical protein